MKPDELRQRTLRFAVDLIKLADQLPRTAGGRTIAQQLSDCGGSVGANYRAVCRARSRADFVAKMATCVEEADECGYWLDVIVQAKMAHIPEIERLRKESNELVAIFSASLITAKRRVGSAEPSRRF